MKKLHHIIAAIDFTPSCRRALREAVRRASNDDVTVTAIHVMSETLVGELKCALSVSEADIRAEWEAKLAKFVRETEGTPEGMHTEVRVGHPYSELVEACHTHQADLLVMGVKGSKDKPHRVGVIAAKCVRDAPVDVMLVRHETLQPFRHILVCVDFSENSAKAVQCALLLAGQDQAVVECLHVYQSPLAMALDYGGFVTALPMVADEHEGIKRWEAELKNFLEPLTRKADGVEVLQTIAEGVNIRETIIEHVERNDVDLVVLGTRGKGALRHMLIGTTAEKIVQHAPCSILAVKPDDLVIEAQKP